MDGWDGTAWRVEWTPSVIDTLQRGGAFSIGYYVYLLSNSQEGTIILLISLNTRNVLKKNTK